MTGRRLLMGCAVMLWVPQIAGAYPGGTPEFQTDVAPFCAACHSSVSAESLAGAGPRAEKELAANKHLAPILGGEGNYKDLPEADRKNLVAQIEALDANSRVELAEFPSQVAPGATFNVTVMVTGGAGPVVGVGLVDRAHRWYARPASASGWEVVGAPTIIGPDDHPQSEWLERRAEQFGRGLTFVNVAGISSNAQTGQWSSAKVVYTLRAPLRPGDYPLVGVYLYGTEKATTLGSKVNPVTQQKQPLGGYGGRSGRVAFSSSALISVKSAP